MLQPLRKAIIQTLWHAYLQHTPQMQIVAEGLSQKNITHLYLDHFAVIDLPGPHTGIAVMQKLFSLLGFTLRGQGYLPEKQNDFHWLAEENAEAMNAQEVLPQIVVADFRLDEMPKNISNIILKYASQARPFPFAQMESLLELNTQEASQQIHQLVTHYFSGRDWPLPTVAEFTIIKQFNELLAWVLVFGRRPNHFTLSIHHLDAFENLYQFLDVVSGEWQLELNQEGGMIKGGASVGLEQGSTTGVTQTVTLQDGEVPLPTGFIEFIWRFPQKQPATLWGDYFTGFIAANANRVIESLYSGSTHETCS